MLFFFLIALASSTCTDMHYVDDTWSTGETCTQFSYRGSECGDKIKWQKNHELWDAMNVQIADGVCPGYTSGYICCGDESKAFSTEKLRFLTNCVEQTCEYHSTSEIGWLDRAQRECVEISTGLVPSNKMNCDASNPTNPPSGPENPTDATSGSGPSTSSSGSNSGSTKEFSNEHCSSETSSALIALPFKAEEKGGKCDALKELYGQGLVWTKSRDEVLKVSCDCYGPLSEKDLKQFDCEDAAGNNLFKDLATKCQVEASVMDTFFGLFPEGGKLWLFVAAIAAVFVLIICCFFMCYCCRRSSKL